MSTHAEPDGARPVLDPFGTARREGVLRRLAGATGALVVVAAGLFWFPAGALLAAAVVYVVGLPLSYVLERWRPAARAVPLGRYAGLGALIGLASAALFGGPLSPVAWVAALFATPIGMVAGAVVPAVGIRTPQRAVPWIAAAGAVALAAGATAVTLAARPPAPYGTWVIVEAVPEVVADVDDVDGLADRVIRRADRIREEGQDPTTHDAWVDVGPPVVERLRGDHRAWVAAHDIRPVTLVDGRRARLATIDLGGQRRCVAVLVDQTAVLPGTCDADVVAERVTPP